MKVLLDECLPKKLKYELEADEATTVPEAGWASKTNGELLSLAEADFDVFLTRDQNLEYQQNLKRFDLAIIVLVAPTNEIDDLRPLMSAVNKILRTIKPRDIKYVGGR